MIFTTKGHTLEFRGCSTGSIDPWSLDYARENNIRLVGTSDIATFMLVDGDDIFKLKGSSLDALLSLINSNNQDFDSFINEFAYPCGSLKESIGKLNKFRNDIIS